jgi:hypothetical protein
MAVAALLFLLAFVRGTDAVAAIPRWWCIILYSGNAIGICIWLLKAAANNGAPTQTAATRAASINVTDLILGRSW